MAKAISAIGTRAEAQTFITWFGQIFVAVVLYMVFYSFLPQGVIYSVLSMALALAILFFALKFFKISAQT